MTSLIVTTSLGWTGGMAVRAQELAGELEAPYIPRLKLGLPKLFAKTESTKALVVDNDGLALHHRDGTVYRYHPNLGFVRAFNFLNGHRDLFIEASQLSTRDRVLDCTLGFAGEAILAALIVGEEGRVVGLESVPELAAVTRDGLAHRILKQPKLIAPMRRIEVITSDYPDYLQRMSPGEFDVICFDPFFDQRIAGSEINIDPLLKFGNPEPLEEEAVLMAIEMAEKRVVVKHPSGLVFSDRLVSLRRDSVIARRMPIAYSVFSKG